MSKMAVLASIAIAAFVANADIYMAGDSTMCNYNPAKQYPQQGWGQALALYMKDPSKLHNWAVGGRSARSYKAEGRWQKIVDALKPGDWVVVAFGHNDANKAKKERYSSPDDYKAIMRSFMEDVRAKGASPVLATSIPHSGGFSEKDGVMSVRGGAAGIGPYVAKTRELAAEMEVPLLDLNRFAEEALPKLGLEKANALYMRIKPGEYKRLPDGLKDGCHTRDTGAYFYARAAVQMAREQKLKMCDLFKSQSEVAFNPYPWGGPGGDVKPLKDDFSEEEIPYAGAAGVGMRETIQSRIDAAHAAGGGVVSVPRGEHAINGPIRLKSGVELHLEDGATLVFADDPALYLPAVPSSWEGVECLNYSPLVYAYGATNVAITGKGTLAPKMDFWRTWFGRGKGHREATRRLYDWCSFNAPMNERDLTKIPESNVRPHLIQFNRCGNVRLEGFRVRESPFWTIHLFLCDGAVVRGLDVYAHGHNNDGIDIEMTKNVLVENCRFDQGDDAVVVKSGRNQDAWRLGTPSENIEVRNCTVVNGHVLLGIGSEMSGGVRNVWMHDCVLESEALRLFYVKTNERRGGFVEDIRMENVKAKKVRRGVMAVETDVLYQWRDFPTHEVRVTPIRNLSMKNVAVEEAERLVDIRGDKRLPVDGVALENVRVARVLKPDRIENAVNVVVNAEGEVAARGAPAAFAWPEPTQTMKPWVYNWWMGSAVDKPGLEFQCRELKDKGFGGFHVIPIYGAKGGYEKNWKPLLSPQWIEAWNLAAGLASYNGLGIDLTMGSGWCFGGPWIDKEHAASSGMKVKRAGVGGQGYMLDPFDPEAMKRHVAAFEGHFGKRGDAARPRAFYHDSYEYYGAEPKKGQDIDESQLACFKVWTDWCRENGYITRNEAHGAPSNWLDFYALADIPETEMFGKNDRDILVSKFASSAAHVKGTKLVSAESCTWIDEHFCERPAEIKAFLDRLFLSGVNHVFYHGCCYSPIDAVWPGWCFYASLEMNPRNPIWRETGALNAYVTRCQSLFQTWTPDNDLAILWDPASFRAKHAGEVACMTVHSREWFYGEPIGKAAKELFEAGYAFDYVSPRMVAAGLAKKYAVVVDPAGYCNAEAQSRREETLKGVRKMPFDAQSGLLATRWRKDGATAYFVVNTGSVARVVSAAEAFTAADPLSGTVRKTRAAEIGPLHSLFVVGDGFGVAAAGAAPETGAEIAGPWQVSALCGGPELPAPRALDRLAGWETFDAFFSGTMLYRTGFDADPASARRTISLGEVREIARVRLNGRDLGVKFMPPYDFEIPDGVLKGKGNELEVEVTNLGANRLRWNDLNGVDWKYFTDINMVDSGYKKFDASKWKPMPSGLLGPVRLSVPASVP